MRLSPALVILLALGCAESPAPTSRAPVYEPEARAVLDARCARCHAGPDAAGAWRATSFTAAAVCDLTDGGADDPVLRALERDDHRAFASEAERALLRAWRLGGARPRVAGVHDEGFGDPRSQGFHARALRATRWSSMLDASAPAACGRCHDGAPTRPAGVLRGSPGATPCSTCHARAEGALACDTCHRVDGSPGATGCAAPQGDRARDAHAAHLSPRVRAQPYACSTCHPARDTTLARGEHGDGVVQVAFDPALAGPDARYDAAAGTCTVACHNRGGARPTPTWREPSPMGCDGCHGAPPRDHPPGECARCHAEADARGAALRPGPLHLNGRVDLGDGTEGCSACHGRDGDPWPETGAHALHREGSRARGVACESCHAVPGSPRAAGHLDGVVQVSMTGPAALRGATPRWQSGTCSEVACHGAGLGQSAPELRWDQPSSAPGCGGCHGAPPPPPHPADTGCSALLCHGGSVAPSPSGPVITAAGRARHIDGVVQFGRAP